MRRRTFIRSLAGGIAARAFTSVAATVGGASRPVVCEVPAGRLLRRQDDIDAAACRRFLDRAVVELTDRESAGAAWRSLFTPGERVALKLSCLPGKKLSTSRGLVQAVVAALADAGVAPRHVLVWERSRRELENAGFRAGFAGAQVTGSDELADGGYADDIQVSGSVASLFSRVLEQVDSVVNLPVVKHHDLAGLSAGMKNFFGAIHNPNKFHANRCDPYVADLCAHPLIRGKLRLVIADATRIQAHNGPSFYPSFAVEHGGLLAGIDPVAVDCQAWRLLDEARRGLGIKTLAEAGIEPLYLASAARIGLGVADPGRIRLVGV